MDVRDLLFEIGTEEIPARFMPWALEEIKKIATEEFQKERLVYKAIESYGTPRRLVILVRGLQEKQDDLVEEIKGPLWSQAFDIYNNPTEPPWDLRRAEEFPLRP